MEIRDCIGVTAKPGNYLVDPKKGDLNGDGHVCGLYLIAPARTIVEVNIKIKNVPCGRDLVVVSSRKYVLLQKLYRKTVLTFSFLTAGRWINRFFHPERIILWIWLTALSNFATEMVAKRSGTLKCYHKITRGFKSNLDFYDTGLLPHKTPLSSSTEYLKDQASLPPSVTLTILILATSWCRQRKNLLF